MDTIAETILAMRSARPHTFDKAVGARARGPSSDSDLPTDTTSGGGSSPSSLKAGGRPDGGSSAGRLLRRDRPTKRSMVVYAGSSAIGDHAARALASTLSDLGCDTVYLGSQCAEVIAQAVAEEQADAVELCLSETGCVRLVRDLLRELILVGRREVSIVVHRYE
jgi:hypothetical protein